MELRWLRKLSGREMPTGASIEGHWPGTYLELQYNDGDGWKSIPIVESETYVRETVRRQGAASEMGSLAGLYGVGKNGGELAAETRRLRDAVVDMQMAPPWNPKPWWKIW